MPVIPLERRFLQGLGAAATQPLGLAVSGGGDSMALLHLAAAAGLALRVVTVDHGLRPEAAAEAALVARHCAALGVNHSLLHWQGWQGQGNLQDQARRARRRLIAEWALGQGLQAVALGHSQDDVAETFLMRLARGAGVDGLSAMAASWAEAGVIWHRPLLTASRTELRRYLAARGLGWADDPSNEAVRFDRVRMRKLLPVLAPHGLTAARLAEVAGHLAEARQALDQITDTAARRWLRAHAGAVQIDLAGLAGEPDEVQRRLLQRVLLWIVPGDYPPRGPALARLRLAVLAGQAATLAGCRFVPQRGRFWACRETRGLAGPVPANALWDGRWRWTGDAPAGAELRALGAEGLACHPAWRDWGLPRAAALGLPGLWLGQRLLAAPLTDSGENGALCPVPGPAWLYHSALSH